LSKLLRARSNGPLKPNSARATVHAPPQIALETL